VAVANRLLKDRPFCVNDIQSGPKKSAVVLRVVTLSVMDQFETNSTVRKRTKFPERYM